MSTTKPESLGFLGLGQMGVPMARNLLRAFGSLSVYDVAAGKATVLTELGAVPVGSPAELAAKCSLILTSLPGPAEIGRVALGDGGLVAALKPGSLWIDTSTNDPSVARKVAAEIERHGSAFADAPVTGGVAGAEEATLKIMVGASEEAFHRALPVLSIMGSETIHCGSVGTGSVMKLLLNFMGLAHTALVAEGLTYGMVAGLTVETMLETLRGSWGDNGMLQDTVETAKVGDWGFSRALAMKDISLATALAHRLGVRTDLMDVVQRLVAGTGSQSGDLWELVREYEQAASARISEGVIS